MCENAGLSQSEVSELVNQQLRATGSCSNQTIRCVFQSENLAEALIWQLSKRFRLSRGFGSRTDPCKHACSYLLVALAIPLDSGGSVAFAKIEW